MASIRLPPYHILLQPNTEGATYRPGFLLLLDVEAEAVVLSVRGTMRLHDVLTDLVCTPVPFAAEPTGRPERSRTCGGGGGGGGGGGCGGNVKSRGDGGGGGYAHGGMIEAAKRFREEIWSVRLILLLLWVFLDLSSEQWQPCSPPTHCTACTA
jgi:hypothetical protein